MGFNGFPEALFSFLEELKVNNNRPWFQENKPRYEQHIVAPVQGFIESVGHFLPIISESFVADTRRQGGSMFRIYRDARFTKDKRPYKEHIGCQFRHRAGKDAHAPGFYVHISPHEVFVGGGVWTPPNNVLDEIRQAIVANPGRWADVVNDPVFCTRYGGVVGDGLKRAPRGYDPDHLYIDDLKRKSFFAVQHLPPESILSVDFIDEVESAFEAVSPLMGFLCRAVKVSY